MIEGVRVFVLMFSIIFFPLLACLFMLCIILL